MHFFVCLFHSVLPPAFKWDVKATVSKFVISWCYLSVGNMTRDGSKNRKRSCLLPTVHYQEQRGLSSFAFGSLLFRNNLRVLKEDFDIYCLVLAGLDKGDKVACDKARKLFVIYCATTVSESVFVCLKCIS